MTAVYMLVIFISLGFLLAGLGASAGYYSDPDEYGFHTIMTADLYMGVSVSILTSSIAVLVLSRIQSFSF